MSEVLIDDNKDEIPTDRNNSKIPVVHEINQQDGFNPQEASSDETIDITRVESTTNGESENHLNNDDAHSNKSNRQPQTDQIMSDSNATRKSHVIHRRKQRASRRVTIDDQCLMGKGLSLPLNQFETIICRRTIYKRDVSVNIGAKSFSNQQQSSLEKDDNWNLSKRNNMLSYVLEDDPIESTPGDISLGMKLSVVGGKVIVQHLKPLEDGTASPAQLTGVISRGDVLLAINEKSLVNLTLDQLMNALGPLSAPDPSGSYRRKLKVRFASKQGFEELRSIEVPIPLQIQQSDMGLDIANDMFALFPMVEQLTNLPSVSKREEIMGDSIASLSNLSNKDVPTPQTERSHHITPVTISNSKDELIAKNLSAIRIRERDELLREFDSWNRNFEDDTVLQPDSLWDDFVVDNDFSSEPIIFHQVSELSENKIDILVGANALSRTIEEIDNGKSTEHALRSWNTTLSLFSRASRRGKRIFDGASLPARLPKVIEKTTDDVETNYETDSNLSLLSEEEDGMGGDELLVHLASQDNVWRKQLLDVLTQLSMRNEEEEDVPMDDDDNNNNNMKEDIGDLDATIAHGLGNLLFGEDMTRILKNPGKPRSLPCDEATSLLYDLATKVSSSIPREISGADHAVEQQYDAYHRKEILANGNDIQAARTFLIEEALPVWLKSFVPLPWEHRRILWPLDAPINMGGSTAASSMSDDITLESFGVGRPTATTPNRRDIVTIMEDKEFNIDIRNET
jgi:hypothetical protein